MPAIPTRTFATVCAPRAMSEVEARPEVASRARTGALDPAEADSQIGGDGLIL